MTNQMHKQTLTILHTNDIHSHFEKMGSIAAMIQREREQAVPGEEILVLDIGDHMDRMAVETEGSMGGANIDVLNITGYDAVTIGNNEGLTFTPDILDQAYAGLLCKVVCGNLIEERSGQPPAWMEPSAILTKGDIRIGILGSTAPFRAFYELLRMKVLNPIDTLKLQAAGLREQADIVILLSHLGITTDQRIAEEIDGIDIILGGHTHHVLEKPLEINKTLICGAGKYGQYLGKITVERSSEEDHFKLVSGGCMPVDDHLLHENVAAAIITHREQAENKLGRTIAVTDRPLTIHWDRESSFGNLLAQAVRQFTGTDLAVVNAGQLLGDLEEGNITEGMLHALCPSPINACTILLKGADLRTAMEESLIPEYRDLVFKGFGFRGYQLGVLCIDGAEVHYDPTKPPYERITELNIQGIPLNDNQLYRVGTLDMFTFNVGYHSLSLGSEPAYHLPEFIRDLIAMELKRPNSLDECLRQRWILE
ncbi:bifunctional UDP-sugar hydrolase/5'-nucleotidase [Paenibacillus sp. MER 78]|uniref:bifunctional metallophosphatase/5'-nucleotidase n=1 Tax=Paenibacillus sp. MER 78 TaxID=2939571 RepID=UPI00204117A0|nr:bifunctional UDP-sugar hydrolase/5'-nucleotidase [Paenibacillus sp. MER 78]MCM3127323.1 bifunctional metallophosphatase/5'-nucleotidase [Paenibacillus sp. MER 78]